MLYMQITYQNDDQSAASELAKSLQDASWSPIYIPNFGQVQVSGVSQLDAPVVPQFTRWEPTGGQGSSCTQLHCEGLNSAEHAIFPAAMA